MSEHSHYIVDEIRDDESEAEGSILCPVCGAVQVEAIGWKGGLESFEIRCHTCENTLLGHSAVFVTGEYYQEHGKPSTDELREWPVS